EHASQNGIIYCSTRSATEEVFATLASEGFAVAMYHAGMDDIARQRNQDDFVFDRKSIMVATNAFGMGIDKSNIGFVFHYNMPRDLESYYQEAGRAGRDGSPANCILIYNKKDVQTAIYFADKNHEDRHQQGMDTQLSETLYQRDLDRVRKMTAYCKTTDCLRSYVLRYFGESESPYRCEHCSSCEAESETIEATVEAQKILSCVLRLEQRDRRVGRVMIVDILRGSRAQNVLRSQFDQLSTYGIMSDVPLSFAHSVLDALIDEGYLSVSAGRYPVIGITAQGNALIKQRGSFIMKVAKAKIQATEPADSPAPQQRSKTEKPAAATPDANIDQSLLAKLKALRRNIASEQNLPAFIVFHDSTLIDMCLKRPTNIEEFLLVSGVGQHKADLYGEKFLACLNEE
ncbi:MAG: HRDC domain-containing protein, partial [Coriobacteriales bacterium]|nr:HRDC domain-containing protein [Coriobacteriales bacterium]